MDLGTKHLTMEHRFFIEKELGEQISACEIARKLGVNRSTIYREIKRNTRDDFKGLYCYRVAQQESKARKSKASQKKKGDKLTAQTVGYINDRLKVHTSPDVIAGEMKHRLGLSISKNTIYRYVQNDKCKGGSLYKLLPHRGKPYNRRSGNAVKVNIPGRTGIEL